MQLTKDNIELGMRVKCISPSFKCKFYDGHSDIYGQSGYIRQIVFPDMFYIEWDDPYFNKRERGKEYWTLPIGIFEVSFTSPEKELAFRQLEQERLMREEDQKQRLSHAMKYL